MPKMSEQAQKASVYQKSRKRREEEMSAVQDIQISNELSASTTMKNPNGKRVGRPLSSKKTGKMSIVMEPELRRKLKTYCALQGTTAADVIDKLLREFLKKVPDFPTTPTA